MEDTVSRLREIVADSDNIVFFGGAGVSTESGIPDFRSADGLYSQKYKYPPEEILSGSFLRDKPEEFYRYYHDKLTLGNVRPNACHIRLAELERQGKLKAVVTQNIDGLHQMAGSKNVLELHGSIHRCYCSRCGKKADESAVNEAEGVPYCGCGGVLRPDVVLYEEQLDTDLLREAVRLISECDILIVGGTSLAVYPAASLINFYRGDKLVLINRDKTARDSQAKLRLHANLGEVFSQI
jgi:NAD-dependent deacetylase